MTIDHKSEEMEILAKEHGWQTQLDVDLSKFEQTLELGDMIWTMYAKRDDEFGQPETIKVVWTGNLQTECLYKYGNYTLRPVRKAPVVALLKGSPNPNNYRKGQDDSGLSYEERIKNRKVGFDNDSSAFDILVAVIGKNVTWVRPDHENRFAEGCESERTENVSKISNLGKSHFRVKTTLAGKRVLEWSNAAGFHACYIEDILSVS